MVDVVSPMFIGSAALVIAATQVVKLMFPFMADRWLPAVAIGFSALLAALQVLADTTTTSLIVQALVTAFVASGVYSQQKAVRGSHRGDDRYEQGY